MNKKSFNLLLATCMLVMAIPMTSLAKHGNSDSFGKHHHFKAEPKVYDIKSIQAYTDFCWYGQKLTKVKITYNGNVDLSEVTPDTYTLLDRGYANPDFAEATIDSISVRGKVVTLNITVDTEALDNNSYTYTGDDATGPRAKNPIGLYSTGSWYRDVNSIIHFSDGTAGYQANSTGEGYQTRESLELKLFHTGETVAEAACLANEDGSYNKYGLWRPTIDANYGKRGFMNFEELGINVPTTATDGDVYVKGWAYFPKDFHKHGHKKYPLIITITGYGTSYWKRPDGTNNFGTGLNFDGSGFRWMDSGAIVLNIHDRSHTGGADYKFWVDDYNVIQYFIDNYDADPEAITLTGNSRGTDAVCRIAREYPGLVNTLIINNGSIGSGLVPGSIGWNAEDWRNTANHGTRIWAFDGELDTNNIDNYQKAISYYKAAGWSDEWIAKNIRLTGFPTQLYYYWGETDHSTTKMTYWYFYNSPYYGPDCDIVDGKLIYNNMLNIGDTYQLNGRLFNGIYNKPGFNYKIYGETLRHWVLFPEPAPSDGEELPRLDPATGGTISAVCKDIVSNFSYPSTTITSSELVPAGDVTYGSSELYSAPEHCLVKGSMNNRTGVSTSVGSHYAIGFEMRMPINWNGRFYYQANGGIDGSVAPAVGRLMFSNGPEAAALGKGFAVISSDAGHQPPAPFFGLDPQARLDYGYNAVAELTPMAKDLIKLAYGKQPDRSYFGGCSNGGRHTMVAAARSADQYDGFLAGHPGFNLPKAAVTQIYGAQQYSTLVNVDTTNNDTVLASLQGAITAEEFDLVAEKVLEQCDGLDGASDGMVADTFGCQAAFDLDRDVPTCTSGRDGTCLTAEQKIVLANVMAGPKNSSGEAIYTNFPYDAGMSGADWFNWEYFMALNRDPGAVGYIFTTPPTPYIGTQSDYGFLMSFNVENDASKIYATDATFTESTMEFMTPPNPTDLSTLKSRGAKLLVIHGTSDAVFSPLDTVNWYKGLQRANSGDASNFARLFLVPGENHCGGGPTTDKFDALDALVDWVEGGVAPESITASVRAENTELPASWAEDRTRPLCPYPLVAKYVGTGSIEDATNFSCEVP
jgi:feruloyl esterase